MLQKLQTFTFRTERHFLRMLLPKARFSERTNPRMRPKKIAKVRSGTSSAYSLIAYAHLLVASGSGSGTSGPILSFSGDPEEMEEDQPVDLFGQAAQEQEEEEEGHEQEQEEDGEPEDDFNAAWEVLDLARAIYDKQHADDGDDEVKLKLADTYIALGDVSLETGEFNFYPVIVIRVCSLFDSQRSSTRPLLTTRPASN